MADHIRQLLSQTSYAADGSTTVWNFSFAGGYLDKSHVKAKYLDAAGIFHTITVTPGMFTGPFQLSITPALAAGNELTIYRDTPKDLPIVDFADKAALTEAALDLNAKQAVFVAAESADVINTTVSSADIALSASSAAASASAAAGSASGAADSAAGASGSASAAAGSANAAADSAAALLGSNTASLIGYQPPGSGTTARNVASKLGEFVSLRDLGAVGDGVTNDAGVIAAINASGRSVIVVPPGTFYINSGVTLTTKVILIDGGGEIKFGPSGNLSYGAHDIITDGVRFAGTMNDRQYTRSTLDLASYFTTPTYDDGTNAVDGSDFTHSLDSGILSVGTAALNTRAIRNVVSAHIPLDPTKKYVIHYPYPLIVDGISGKCPVIQYFNGAGTLLGTYDSADSNIQTPFFTGASSMKIKLGVSRGYHTAVGLTTRYQIAQFRLMELTNDAAALTYNVPTWDNVSIVVPSTVRGVRFSRCKFRNFSTAVITMFGAVHTVVEHSAFERCIQGVSINGGMYNTVVHNTFDMRFCDEIAVRHNNLFTRTRAISAAGGALNTTASHNAIVGANWGIEMTPGCSFTTLVSNVIDAENCGISIDGAYNLLHGNTINLNASGLFGIETPMSSYTKVTFNTVNILGCIGGIGISVSNTGVGNLVAHNDVTAHSGIMGLQGAGTDVKLRVEYNTITYSHLGIFCQCAGATVTDNTLHLAASGGTDWSVIPSGAIFFDKVTSVLQVAARNNFDCSTDYGLRVLGAVNLELTDNRMRGIYAAKYSTYITTSGVTVDHLIANNSLAGVVPTSGSAYAYDGGLSASSNLDVVNNRLNRKVVSIGGAGPATTNLMGPDTYLFTGSALTNTAHTAHFTLPANGTWLLEIRVNSGGDANHGEVGTYLVRSFGSASTPDLASAQLLGAKVTFGANSSTDLAVMVTAIGVVTFTWSYGATRTSNYTVSATSLQSM